MDRKDSIDNLVKAFEEKDYGDIMTFEEIERITGKRYGTIEHGSIMQATRKRLIDAGHMIVNVRGIGYKVCSPDGYTGEGVRYMRHGAKKIDRGVKIIHHAPVNDMSQQAREEYNRVKDRMITLQAAMAGACVEIHMLEARHNPLLQAK